MARQAKGAPDSAPGTAQAPDDPPVEATDYYRSLGALTTGQAATDLAAELDEVSATDVRRHRRTMNAAGARVVDAAQAAGRAALRAAAVATEAAATGALLDPISVSTAADRPASKAAGEEITRLAQDADHAALLAERAAIAAATATRLAELSVIEYERSRRRGTEGPNAPRSNVY